MLRQPLRRVRHLCGGSICNRGLKRHGLFFVSPHIQTNIPNDRKEPDHKVSSIICLPMLIKAHKSLLEGIMRHFLIVEDSHAVDVDLLFVPSENFVEGLNIPLLSGEKKLVIGAIFLPYGWFFFHISGTCYTNIHRSMGMVTSIVRLLWKWVEKSLLHSANRHSGWVTPVDIPILCADATVTAGEAPVSYL